MKSSFYCFVVSLALIGFFLVNSGHAFCQQTSQTRDTQTDGNPRPASFRPNLIQSAPFKTKRAGKQIRYFGFDAIDSSKRSEFESDISVLKHLLSKLLQTSFTSSKMGVTVMQNFGSHEAMYVEHRGLILTYQVGFPVAPPEISEPSSEDEKPEVVDVWENARMELETGRTKINFGMGLRGQLFTDFGDVPETSIPYKPKHVASLADGITDALVHIGRIRHLKSGDDVTVYVRGPSNVSNNQVSVLVVSAKVSDVNSNKKVRKDDIKTEQFHEVKLLSEEQQESVFRHSLHLGNRH